MMRALPILCLLAAFGSPVLGQSVDGKGAAREEAPEPAAGKGSGTEACRNGFAGSYPCENLDLLSAMSREDIGAGRFWINDLWGWEDPVTGKRYVVLGREDGTSFIDVTAPEAPVLIGDLPLTFGARASVWRDVKVYADHAFIVADGAGAHGMQVFDLTQLRSQTGSPPVTFSALTRYEGFGSAHNIVINEDTGFAYAVGSSLGQCDLGLHMIDISDPARPVFAGCHLDERSSRGYVHDAQCVVYRGPDTQHVGREVCFGSNESAFSIVDVTDKRLVRPLGIGTYPTSSYVHQGWLSEDHRYFYMNDEGDERRADRTRTLIWDVEDLDDPQLVVEFLHETSAIDHNLYVHDGFLFEANYTSGLQVLDISVPDRPFRVAYFDTTPNNSDVSFNGTWSVYPYFSDGTIALSGRAEGLFLLQLTGVLVSELAEFRAQSTGSQVAFTWTMRRQKEVAQYRIEYLSRDGEYYPAAEIAGGGDRAEPQTFQAQTATLPEGRVEVRLVAVSSLGDTAVLASTEVFVVPGTHVLKRPYPNPVSAMARASLVVGRTQVLTVEAFDASGRRVASLFDGVLQSETELALDLDVTAWPAGRYWIRYSGRYFNDTATLVVTH